MNSKSQQKSTSTLTIVAQGHMIKCEPIKQNKIMKDRYTDTALTSLNIK